MKHILLWVFLVGSIFFSSARQTHGQNTVTPSCVVRIFKEISDDYSIEQAVGADLIAGEKYRLSVSVYSPGNDAIRSMYSQMAAQANEPLTIVGVNTPLGTCSISSNKLVSCENLNYPYTQKVYGVYHLTVVPSMSGSQQSSSVLFSFQTDQGKAVCTTMNKIVSAAGVTPLPKPVLPAVSNVRVLGYRSLTGPGSNYKEAVLTWSPLTGAQYYGLYRVNSDSPYAFGGTKESTYTVRFLPETQWDVAIKAADDHWVQGELSAIVHIAYPGYDTLPTVPSSTYTPAPSATPPELTAPKNLRIIGFEKIENSNQLNAVVSWSPVPGAQMYELYVQKQAGTLSNIESGIHTTQGRVAGYPGDTLSVSVGVVDTFRGIRLASAYFPIVYPRSVGGTPIPSPRPILTASPVAFDSSKVALLEDKVHSLEQKLLEQEKTNVVQSQRIEQHDTLLSKIRNFLARWFRI